MNLLDLKTKLNYNNIPEKWYSLNEGSKPDALILLKNYSIWEFFYFDEKGDKNNYKVFKNEEEACDYMWKEIERMNNFYKKNNLIP